VLYYSNYVWWYGTQCCGVEDRPGESCFWQSVVTWPVFAQERLREWRCGSLPFGRRPYADSRVQLTGSRKVHSSWRGSVLSLRTPTVPGMARQCPGWRCGGGDGRAGLMVMEEMCLTGLTSRRRPERLRDRRPSSFRGFHRPLPRVRRPGRMGVGSTVSRS
jgi:hypothetical protein